MTHSVLLQVVSKNLSRNENNLSRVDRGSKNFNEQVDVSKDVVICGRGICKNYGERKIIDNVEISIKNGSFISLIGPSGCGKSTLLRILANLETMSDGNVWWWGLDNKILGSPGRRVSMVFQDATLMPWASVLKNVALPLELRGEGKKQAYEAAANALALVKLTGKEEFYPRELSGGMQMRVAIARALVTKPNILFMDEPFGALDEITRNQLNEDVLRLQSELEMTIIFVTHSIQEAVFVSSEILVMKANPGVVAKKLLIPKPARFWEDSDTYRVSDNYFDAVKNVSHAFKLCYHQES
ncbi:MAG: ABC transporter ATP-binding protein [Candidatus Dormibacteria bacterium]